MIDGAIELDAPANSMELATITTMLPTILAADENDILGSLARKIAAHKPDISTAKGRDEIRALAANVASSKMNLIRLGKSMTEGWRKQTAMVNAECRTIEERMDALKDQVRQPLTEFEEREKTRVAAHEAAIAEIVSWRSIPEEWTAEQIQARIEELKTRPYSERDWQEFGTRAREAAVATFNALKVAAIEAAERERLAAEEARLAAEEAERQRVEAERLRAEHEAKIAAEAAERAKQEAERIAAEQAAEAERQAMAERERLRAEADAAAAAAEAERQRLLREGEAQRIAAEQERAAAAKREQEAKERAERAEREAKEAAERVEREKVALAEKAERDRQAAVEAERQRIAEQQTKEREAAAERERNVAHRRKINREASQAIILAISEKHSGTAEESKVIAQAVITAIAKGEIPHVRIQY